MNRGINQERTDGRLWKTWLVLILSLVLSFSSLLPSYADEEYAQSYDGDSSNDSSAASSGSDNNEDNGDDDSEEEVFIPEEYYDPIQSNEIEGWPQGEAVQAAGAIVMDLDTNAILYAKNIENTYYPASITKIMTALVALENGNLDDVICCGSEVYDIEEDASNLAMQEGEELTLRDALYGLMLESANDLGNAIAVHIGGSISGFAQMMNEKAAQLGCTHTHFVNPHGLHDDDHYTCALDMAKISQAAYENEVFRQIISTKEYAISPTNKTEDTRYFANHQQMIQPSSDYYQSWCTGGKTGFTSAAWNTLVTFGEKDGMRLVCVLLHGNGAKQNYLETTDLCEYGFEYFQHKQITDSLHSEEIYDILKADNAVWEPETEVSADPSLTQPQLEVEGGVLTLPTDAALSDVKVSEEAQQLSFSYHNWPVGYGVMTRLVPETQESAALSVSETESEWQTETETETEPLDEIERTAQVTMEQLRETVSSVVTGTQDFARRNREMVIAIAVFVLAIIVFLTGIVIARCTRKHRLRVRRRKEEKERLRLEEEIDAKSAAAIEKELRKAMQDERSREETKEERERSMLIAQERGRQEEQLREEAQSQKDSHREQE